MWDWITGLGSGLASLFGDSGSVAAAEVAPYLADPSFTFGVSGAATDIAGNAVSASPTFFDSAYSLGVPGFAEASSAVLRPSVFDLSLGAAQPLGHLGESGQLTTLDGNPVASNPFGINQSGGASLNRLRDALGDLVRGRGPGGPGGGGSLSVSMPQIDSPTAERVSAQSVSGVPAPGAAQTSALPSAPPLRDDFQPLSLTTPPDDGEALRGLLALLRRA